MSNWIKRLIIYTQYTLYVQNVTSKNAHVIVRNCVLCATGLMLHSVAMLMSL